MLYWNINKKYIWKYTSKKSETTKSVGKLEINDINEEMKTNINGRKEKTQNRKRKIEQKIWDKTKTIIRIENEVILKSLKSDLNLTTLKQVIYSWNQCKTWEDES